MSDLTPKAVDILHALSENNDTFSEAAPLAVPETLIQDSDGFPEHFMNNLNEVLEVRDKELDAALMLISINNIPMMISGYGHKATEETIRSLLYGIKDHLKHDTAQQHITRVQKDQIAIILHHYDQADFNKIGEDLAYYIKHYGYDSEYGMIHILANLSSVEIPQQTVCAEDLMNQAYVAVKSEASISNAKFIPDLPECSQSRQEMNMVNYITGAIKEGQLLMAFQPVIHSKTGAVSYHEALLRVKKHSGELTTAGPLIPVAERMGLIDMIDEIVLDKVYRELQDNPELKLSFNVSNLTANSKTWLKRFQHIAREDPDVVSRMMVEITETAVHLDLRRTAYFVAAIQAEGAKVALDDFGSGYTSFRQLKSLSVDVIKIDGVFISDLVDNHDNHLFIKTMLNFTNGFGLETVAEFVENGETAKILMELGVDYMQGYYFGYPEVKKLSV